MRLLLITAFLALLCANSSAQTPGFWAVGLPPGTTQGSMTALSADGTLGVGWTVGTPGVPGYTWTPANGRYDFGLEPGMPRTTAAHGVSSDGGTIVGSMADLGPRRAYRRVGNGPLEDLGLLPLTHESRANAVSGDGNTVVGTSWHEVHGPAEGQAFRWTPQGGMQGLGLLYPNSVYSEARAISRDGSTIVGDDYNGVDQAFVWRESTGVQALPRLPNSPSITTHAYGVSADGSVIVGSSVSPVDGQTHAVRWTMAGIEDLGLSPAFATNTAYATDDSGDVIGGTSGGPLGVQAFVWTPITGSLLLTDYLASYDIMVPPGWELRNIFAISGDGLTFAGDMRSPEGVRQGFVATIPAPAGMAVLILPAVLFLRRRRGIS